MKLSLLKIAVVTAGLLLPLAPGTVAQDDMGAAAPRQRGGGQGAGGFGGGQAVQGTVTAATNNKVTIKTEAGDTYDITLADTSRVMKAGQQVKLSDVKVGDSVTARGTVDPAKKTVQAMMVNAIDAATIQKAKDDMGKTYITGKISAIDLDNAKLTIARTDGVSQVITLDDGTSIQRGARGINVGLAAAMGGGAGGGRGMGGGAGMGGGRPGGGAPGANGAAAQAPPESITLADVKVGDMITASGALKGDMFVPTKLGVTDASAAGAGGRRRAPGAGAPPPDGASPPAPPQ